MAEAAVLEEVGGHDEKLPHDDRYGPDDPRGCPLMCPARPGLLAAAVGGHPALSWEEHGRPLVAVWWGQEDVVDQVHAGRPCALCAFGDGRLLVAFLGGMKMSLPPGARIRLGPADDHDLTRLLGEPFHAPGCPGEACLGCSARARAELARLGADLEMSSGTRGAPGEVIPAALLSRLLPSRQPVTVDGRVAAVRRMPAYDPAGALERHLAGLARGLAGDVDDLRERARRISAGVAAALDLFEHSLSDRERAMLEERMRRLRAGVLGALAGTSTPVTRPGDEAGDHARRVGMVPGQEN